MDWFVRCYMLAIANGVCIGGAAMIVYGIVQVSRTGGDAGSLVVLSLFLALWVAVGSCVYASFCGAFFPWASLRRPLAPVRDALSRCARACSRAGTAAAAMACRATWATACSHGRRRPCAEAEARGWRRRTTSRVRAAACGRGRGRRGGGAGVRGVPRRGGEGGDGEAAAGVPARVPPAMHRRVAAGQLHLPGLPAQRLRGGAAIAGSNGVVSEMLYAVLAFFCLCLFFFSFNKHHCI